MKKLISTLMALTMLCGCAVVAEEGESAEEKSAAGEAETTAEPASEEEPEYEYSCRRLDRYNYDDPVPYSTAVDDSYYDTTLFAGDSRMGSLYIFGEHKNAEVFYVTSLNLLMIDMMTLDENELTEEQIENEEEVTLLDVLKETRKDNIYLLFGINEIRNPNFIAFGEQLDEIVCMLRENNPNVNVYIILSYHPDLISGLPEPDLTEHLEDLNSTQIEIARNRNMYYLNLDYGMNDEDGTIIDDYVFDGLHFTVDGTTAFEDFIATHVVKEDEYVKEVCE